jgi:hypothetical protein
VVRRGDLLLRAIIYALGIVLAEVLCAGIYRWVARLSWSRDLLVQVAELSAMSVVLLATAFFIGWSNRRRQVSMFTERRSWSARFAVFSTFFFAFIMGAACAGLLVKTLTSASSIAVSISELGVVSVLAGIVAGAATASKRS